MFRMLPVSATAEKKKTRVSEPAEKKKSRVLPPGECFGLRSEQTGKYVQCAPDESKKAGGSRIEATADSVAGERARFFVEPPVSSDADEESELVHIRCCYNNQYWAPVQDGGATSYIVSTADEPDENLSNMTCTLFEPFWVDDTAKSTIRLFHSVIQNFAFVTPDESYIQIRDDSDPGIQYLDTFIVDGLSALPKYVAFKGDYCLGTNIVMSTVLKRIAEALGGFGLTELLGQEKPHQHVFRSEFGDELLQFHTDDIGHASVVFNNGMGDDGTIHIMSSLGEYLKRGSDHRVMPLPGAMEKDPDAPFMVVAGDNFIAIQNPGDSQFCKRLDSDENKNSCLGACDPSISQWARLKVEEPDVVSREIYDIRFYLDEGRVSNKQILTLVTEYSTNDTSKEMKATFSCVKKAEVRSASSKQGVDTKFNLGSNGGANPMVVGDEVTFSSKISNTEETTVTQEYTIPPRTTVTAKIVGMRARCDVPYSYKQRDVLTTGQEVTSIRDDGIYTVAKHYNFAVIYTGDEAVKMEKGYSCVIEDSVKTCRGKKAKAA